MSDEVREACRGWLLAYHERRGISHVDVKIREVDTLTAFVREQVEKETEHLFSVPTYDRIAALEGALEKADVAMRIYDAEPSVDIIGLGKAFTEYETARAKTRTP